MKKLFAYRQNSLICFSSPPILKRVWALVQLKPGVFCQESK